MKNSRAALLPLAIMPAVMPAIFLPLLHQVHVADSLLGLGAGFLIGLSLVSIIAMGFSKHRGARLSQKP